MLLSKPKQSTSIDNRLQLFFTLQLVPPWKHQGFMKSFQFSNLSIGSKSTNVLLTKSSLSLAKLIKLINLYTFALVWSSAIITLAPFQFLPYTSSRWYIESWNNKHIIFLSRSRSMEFSAFRRATTKQGWGSHLSSQSTSCSFSTYLNQSFILVLKHASFTSLNTLKRFLFDASLITGHG